MSEEQKSGIFEPKPLNKDMLPESGAQKAKRIIIVAAAAIVVLVAVLFVRSLWFRPVKHFYKGLNRKDTAQMQEAFPKWLTGADMGEGGMRIEDMCAAVISNSRMRYGLNYGVEMSLAGYTDVEEEKLEQIAEGIKVQFQVNAKVTRGRTCAMDVWYKMEDGSKYNVTEYVTMYRINGSWFILDVPNEKQ